MPSSWSPSLRFELQFTGENINLWGEKLNATLAHADYAVAGWLTKPLSGNATLSTANAGDDEARAAMIKFTGALDAPAAVTIPSVSKSYFVWNATIKPLTITTGAGASVEIAASDKALVFCDGADVHTPGYGGVSIKAWAEALAWTYNAGNLPAQAGAAGKVLKTNGTTAEWAQPTTTDLGDYDEKILGVQVALAVAL